MARVRAMKDEDIDYSDIPDLGPDVWANAITESPKKANITIRLDRDVLEHFKRGGTGYQTRINSVLRTYVAHAVRKPTKPKAKRARVSR